MSLEQGRGWLGKTLGASTGGIRPLLTMSIVKKKGMEGAPEERRKLHSELKRDRITAAVQDQEGDSGWRGRKNVDWMRHGWEKDGRREGVGRT